MSVLGLQKKGKILDNSCEFILFRKFKMLFYEMLQEITLEDNKGYLRTMI